MYLPEVLFCSSTLNHLISVILSSSNIDVNKNILNSKIFTIIYISYSSRTKISTFTNHIIDLLILLLIQCLSFIFHHQHMCRRKIIHNAQISSYIKKLLKKLSLYHTILKCNKNTLFPNYFFSCF